MRIVLLGPPGAGKGTQARKLEDELNIRHLSTGDLLRHAVSAGSDLGCKAKAYMDRGELLPDQVILELMGEELDHPKFDNGFLLDGFPRTRGQAEGLERLMEERGEKIDCAALLKVRDEELMRRLLGRARIEGRSDDTEEVIHKRLEVYETQTRPIVDFYRERGLLVQVDAEGGMDQVFQRLLHAVKAGVA